MLIPQKRLKKRLGKNGTKISRFLVDFWAQRGSEGAFATLESLDPGPGEVPPLSRADPLEPPLGPGPPPGLEGDASPVKPLVGPDDHGLRDAVPSFTLSGGPQRVLTASVAARRRFRRRD